MNFKYLTIYFIIILQWLLPPATLRAQTSKYNVGDEFYLEDLFKQLSECKHDTAKLRICSDIYHNHYNLDTIIKYANLAAETAEKLSDGISQAEALMFIGAVFNSQSRNSLAAEYFSKALNFWIENGNKTKQAICFNCLAVIAENMSFYQTALENYNTALKLFLETGDTVRSARIYRGMANTYNGFNVLETALDYAEKALDIDMRYNETMSAAFDLIYIGNVYTAKYYGSGDLKMLHEAQKYYSTGLETAEKSNFLDVLTESALNLQKICLEKAGKTEGKDFYNALDSSLIYKELSRESIDKMAHLTKEYLYKINESQEFILRGDFKGAKKIIDTLSTLFLSDMSKYENLYYEVLGKVLVLYYQKLSDYKSLCAFEEKYTRYRKLRFNIVFAVNGEYESNKMFFANKLRNLDEKAENEKRKNRFNLYRWLTITAALIATLVFIIIKIKKLHKNAIDGEKDREVLVRQKEEIQKVNDELNRIHYISLVQNNEIEAQSRKIKEQSKEIESTNKAALHSLEKARQIQCAAMPPLPSVKNLFGECLLINNPLEIISGDFYWTGETKDFKIAGVFDCTGHGIPGGLLSMLGISTLNDILSEVDTENIAAGILNGLRKKILSAISVNIYDGIDGAITAVSKNENTLHIAGAMRPVWVVRKGEVIEFLPERMSIGRDKYQNKNFTEHVFKYEKGDKVYMFTDGVTDVFGFSDYDSGQKLLKFSQKRLKTLVSKIADMSFLSQKTIITKTLEDWQNGLKQDTRVDDQLMLGFML